MIISLLVIPLIGVLLLLPFSSDNQFSHNLKSSVSATSLQNAAKENMKKIALFVSLFNMFISILI